MRIRSFQSLEEFPIYREVMRSEIAAHSIAGGGKRIAVVLSDLVGTDCGEDLLHDTSISTIYMTSCPYIYRKICEDALAQKYPLKGVVDFAMAEEGGVQ